MDKDLIRSAIHTHTEYSNTKNLDCIIKLKDLIYSTEKLGYKGVCITDHECLSSHIQALEFGEKIRQTNPDFKVVLGNEIYLVNDREKIDKKRYYHFILLAKDEIGHGYLRELSSRAWDNGYWERGQYRTATLYSDIQEVVKEKGHLIASTSCLGGYFPTLVLQYLNTNSDEVKQNINNFINWCTYIFGEDDFYIELQSGIVEDQIRFNQKALQIAKFYNIKCIITDDVHYLFKEDRPIHEAYLNSREAERELGDFYESCYLKTDEDLLERLNYLDKEIIKELCLNTIEITDKCTNYSLQRDVIVPNRNLPIFALKHLFKDYYSEYFYINKYAYSESDQDRFLLFEVEKGFVTKKQEFNETNLKRINTELETLWTVSEKLKQKLSSYYNLTQLLIDIMWDDSKGNSLVGIARGSVTGFYICYLMDITQINPIEHGLCEWRHLHEARPELPDIDTDSERIRRPFIFEAFKKEFGEDRVLNIITFRTEGSKSSILTACRGLGISLEDAQELADMIPVHRGKAYTIEECLYGDEEDKEPVKGFKNLIEQYDKLLDTVLKIEGIVCGVSSHASGLYIFNNHYVEQNSLMRTPSGQKITCWNMNDSDKAGALKVDILTISNLDMIHTTMNLLLKDGLIEWQGSLRETYKKYLHPDVLDYTTSEMWDMLGNGKATNIFQLSTDVGTQACKLVKPHSLKEMSLVNSLMRLSGTTDELPLEKYKRFKDNLSLWYKEMEEQGLNEDEIKVLENYLLENNGLACEQEDIMLLVQDPKVANFTMSEANKLRKGISKKKKSIIEECKKMFYKKGLEASVSKAMLDYVWNFQVALSVGYSFSRNHTCPYSAIGLQQLNLLYRYPEIYSNTAVLLINSSAEEGNDSNSIDYGKIAIAIGEMQKQGVIVSLPNINLADIGFTPMIETNSIMFGLKGISSVNDEVAKIIIDNRPYLSFEDFIEKTQLTKLQNINLIKAGAFDALENTVDRKFLMEKYLYNLAVSKIGYKDKITASDILKLASLKLVGEKDMIFVRFYNFDKHINQKEFVIDKIKNKVWLIAKDIAKNFFEQYYLNELKEDVDYFYSKDGICFCKSSYNKIYKKRIETFLENYRLEEKIKEINNTIYFNDVFENWNKYCEGSISDWEMDSLSFYYNEHPLAKIQKDKYNISCFKDLSENPILESEEEKNGRVWSRYILSRICGTVLDNDRGKHTITILTHDSEVVVVKFYAGAFIHYNKTIAEINENGKKETKEKSWFKKGNKLIITGFRRGDQFVPKIYYNSIYQHTVTLIENIDNSGVLTLRNLRYGQIENRWRS